MAEIEPREKPSRTEVSTAVRNLKGYKDVTGPIRFDNKGDPLKAKHFVLQFNKQSYPGQGCQSHRPAASRGREVVGILQIKFFARLSGITLWAILACFGRGVDGQTPEKVRLGISDVSFTFLPHLLAKTQGSIKGAA